MREWSKVVLGVAALVVGASAPSLILEATRPGTLAALSGSPRQQTASAKSQDQSQGNTQHPQTNPPAINDEHSPQGQSAIIRQATREKQPWYKQPDWWVAIFTAFLFVATALLWVFTALLWRSTRQAVRDEAIALKIAQSNAKAARDSADALPRLERAYIFFTPDPTFPGHIQGIITGYWSLSEGMPASMPPQTFIRYQFTNHGKTPAIVKSVTGRLVNLPSLPMPLHYDDRKLPGLIIPSAGIFPTPSRRRVADEFSRDHPSTYHDEIDEYQGLHSFNAGNDRDHLTEAEATSLERRETFMWFYGRIIYDDIFGETRKTYFCWRYDAARDIFEQYGEEENRRT
jgi:hypothetical protein